MLSLVLVRVGWWWVKPTGHFDQGRTWSWQGRVDRIRADEQGKYFLAEGVRVNIQEQGWDNKTWEDANVEAGDKVTVVGRLNKGKYQWYVEDGQVVKVAGKQWQSKPKTRVEQEWLGPTGWLMNGLVLGDKSGFETVYWQKLSRAGLTHLVVASGFNVALVGGVLVNGLASFIGRKKALLLGVLAVWGYAGLVGWDAPVVRAAGIISIVYAGTISGREVSGQRVLVVVAVGMLLFKPQWFGSASFWLSVLATYALTFQTGEGLGGSIKDTVRVYLWTWPVVALVFGQVSWGGVISNVLVLPCVAPATLIAGLGMVLGVWVWPVGRIIGWLAYPYLWWLDRVTEWVGSWHLVSNVQVNWWLVLGYYLVLWVVQTKKYQGKITYGEKQ